MKRHYILLSLTISFLLYGCSSAQKVAEVVEQDPDKIMLTNHTATFSYEGGERTIYTFSQNDWKIIRVETRSPDVPELKRISVAPTDDYVGEWYTLSVPEDGNSLIIRTEPYSGIRYRELYITMSSGKFSRRLSAIQYSPQRKLGTYLDFYDSYGSYREVIVSAGKTKKEAILRSLEEDQPKFESHWITFRKEMGQWYMDMCDGVLIYDQVDEMDSGLMHIEDMDPEAFDLEPDVQVEKVMKWVVDFEKAGKKEYIAVISPFRKYVNTDYQILLYEDLTDQFRQQYGRVRQVLVKYRLTSVHQEVEMPTIG